MLAVLSIDSTLKEKYRVENIRGVSPQNAGQYRRAISLRREVFTCFDKSRVIPLSQLNDGYCDCPDGSDEPGTNACGTGEFYCRNTGSVPKLIPKWLVNDGVCDCCDGSDEADNPHAHCEDVCGAIRRRSIQFRSNLTNLTIEGGKLRSKYSERGRLELTIRRKQLQIVENMKAKIDKANELVEIVYWDLKANDDISTKLLQLEEIEQDVNNMFDELEKTMSNVRKGTRKVKTEVPHYGRFNLKHRAELYYNVENAIVWLPDFGGVFYRLNQAFEIVKSFIDAFKYGTTPPKATSNFNKLSAFISKAENHTEKVSKAMSMEFGSDKEFLPLYKQWYYFEDKNYYIEFYPFFNVTRTYKNNVEHSESLGNYNKTEGVFHQLYSDGMYCKYRHPNAQTVVNYHCHMTDEILSFHEIGTCQWELDFGSPAACVDEYKRYVESMDDISLDEWAKAAGLYK